MLLSLLPNVLYNLVLSVSISNVNLTGLMYIDNTLLKKLMKVDPSRVASGINEKLATPF